MLFHIGRAGSTLNVSVRAGESGYTLIASGPRGRVTVQSSGGRGTDVITLNQAGTQQPRVVVRNGRGLAAFSVEFLQTVQLRQSLRALKATGIAIPEGASVEFGVNDRGQALSVNSPEAAIRYDLVLQNLTRKGIESLSRKGVVHPAGLSQTVRPRDWAHLQAAEFLYETHLFPELEYTFKHALTQEVAYEGLLHKQRRQLHERVAAGLEAATTVQNVAVPPAQRRGEPAELAAALQEYADLGIGELQIQLRPNNLEGVFAFAPVLEALGRLTSVRS